MDFKKELNENQYLAVSNNAQYLRVIAGAGSGKTRVLTYRIAYLLSETETRPWEILAITFTNKVANEMRERITSLVPTSTHDLTIKTFHSFSAMFLRREIDVLGYPKSFNIIDEEDQLKLIKDLASESGFKRTDPIVKQTINYISKNKLLGNLPDDIYINKPSFENEYNCLKLYKEYERVKDKMLSLDFDDLLLKATYILENYPDIRIKWAKKYRHILVDEFQDTNDIEFKLLLLLMSSQTYLYVVGDPDQTIYTWRGANQNIILKLKEHFPLVEDVVLDRNYRSTQTILDSANRLISHNKLRLPKNLYTENNVGNKIIVKSAQTGRAEADYVCRTIKLLRDIEHRSLKDVVILYRSNYVTQEFEQSLAANHIPYRIYGGTKFYQRKEIKDVLAYFKLIHNTKDDLSFERIINVPKRGIGEKSLYLIKSEAEASNKSMYEYIYEVENKDSEVSDKVLRTLKEMIYHIDETRKKVNDNDEMFSKNLEDLIIDIGYYDYLGKEDDGDDRIENVKALFDDIRHFIKTNPEGSFDEYLQNISLMSAQDEIVDTDCVTLMTIHTAKGLEFPIVFIVRLNDTVFPSTRSIIEGGMSALEEERRLCYVAITRAMERLYITYCNDYSYVTNSRLTPSAFIKESGNKIEEEKSIFNNSNRYNNNRNNYNNNSGYFPSENKNNDGFFKDEPTKQDFGGVKKVINWKIGDICIHRKFGSGKVIAIEEDGVITVMFPNEGSKTLFGGHPALTKGDDNDD